MSGVDIGEAEDPLPSSEVDGAQLAVDAPEETCFMGRVGIGVPRLGDIKREAKRGEEIADLAFHLAVGASNTVYEHARGARRRLLS